MRYFALATDYDGTLARDGAVSAEIIASLEKARSAGKKLILVTGREMPDLRRVFEPLKLFDRIVAENGALLYNPETGESRALAAAPPPSFAEELRRRGVDDMSVGEVIVATWLPFKETVLDVIAESGLELQVIFNKGAVMVLPSGVNKITGLTAALEELRLSIHNVVGIGDGENDHAFLTQCECGVATSNAIPALQEAVDLVTRNSHGEGVKEIIQAMLDDDLQTLTQRVTRHDIVIGKAGDQTVPLADRDGNVLVCGQSGSGKSTLVTGLLEQWIETKYQVCLFDPEGDYGNVDGCLPVGDERVAPSANQLSEHLCAPLPSVSANLIAVPMGDRPPLFASLLSAVDAEQRETGRPHRIIVDEAHHLFPDKSSPSNAQWAAMNGNAVLVTVHPEHVSPVALESVSVVIAVGAEAHKRIEEFCAAVGTAVPEMPDTDLAPGHVMVWFRHRGELFGDVAIRRPKSEHHRHRRKYAHGELDEQHSFYFRGPEQKLNLRAQNLSMFAQIAEGVDDETWLFHLRNGDYSRWLEAHLTDPPLIEEIKAAEANRDLDAAATRKVILGAIEEKYTGAE